MQQISIPVTLPAALLPELNAGTDKLLAPSVHLIEIDFNLMSNEEDGLGN